MPVAQRAARALGYSIDSVWRNRDTFSTGRDEIVEFLIAKWRRANTATPCAS